MSPNAHSKVRGLDPTKCVVAWGLVEPSRALTTTTAASSSSVDFSRKVQPTSCGRRRLGGLKTHDFVAPKRKAAIPYLPAFPNRHSATDTRLPFIQSALRPTLGESAMREEILKRR